jgi:hypothetical protein
MAALWAGNVDGNRLLHDTFGDSRDNGIDIVQTVVQHIESLFESFYTRSGFFFQWFELITFCHGSIPLLQRLDSLYVPRRDMSKSSFSFYIDFFYCGAYNPEYETW